MLKDCRELTKMTSKAINKQLARVASPITCNTGYCNSSSLDKQGISIILRLTPRFDDTRSSSKQFVMLIQLLGGFRFICGHFMQLFFVGSCSIEKQLCLSETITQHPNVSLTDISQNIIMLLVTLTVHCSIRSLVYS